MTNLNSAELNALINKVNTSSFGEVKANTNNGETKVKNNVVIVSKLALAFIGYLTSGQVDNIDVVDQEPYYPNTGGRVNGTTNTSAFLFKLVLKSVSHPGSLVFYHFLFVLVVPFFPRSIANALNTVLGVKEEEWSETEEGKAFYEFSAELEAAYEARKAEEAAQDAEDEAAYLEAIEVGAIPNVSGKSDPATPTSSAIQTISIKFNTYSNINGVSTLNIIVDRNKGTLAWNGKEVKVNEYLIKVSKVRDERGRQIDDCQVITVDETINLIVKTLVARSKYPNKVLKLLSELKGTVLRSDWEINDDAVTCDYNLAAIVEATDLTVDVQQVLRDNSVVCFHVDHKGLMLSGKKYGWVDGCLAAATEEWGFALPDKTNTKRALIKDGVLVSGRSADGKLSMVKDDKATKQLNREAMIKHTAAEIPNGAEPDNLVINLSDGRYALSYGFKAPSLLINDPLMSASSGDAQIITRKRISSIVNKRLTSSVNIDGLFANNPEFVALVGKKTSARRDQVDVIIPMIKEALLTRQQDNQTLAGGEALVFEGQALVDNNNVFPVNIFSTNVRRGGVLNTECRTIDIDTHCKAQFEDYNVKLRGQYVKGMTGKVDGYQVEGAEEAELILNHNSIKNDKLVALRAWANAKGVIIAWNGSEFRYVNDEGQLGEVVNLEAVEKDLVEMTKSYKVVNVISKEDYETFKAANPEAFSHVIKTDIVGEIVTLTYMADGIEAPLVYAVELSSVQENLSLNRRVSPDRVSFLTTFGMEHVGKELAARMEQVTETMNNAAAKFAGEVFDVNNAGDRTKLVEILANRTKLPARSLFKALAQMFPNGLRIKAQTKEGTRKGEATINPQLLFDLGGFRNDGSSHNATVNEVALLLGLVGNKTSAVNLIVDYVFKLGSALDGWVKDITTQDKAFTKGNALFHTHGMKVLSASLVKDAKGNYLPSYETVTHEGSSSRAYILWINSENPLAIAGTRDKLGNKVKPVREGDVVFGFRNPVMDLIPMIIRFNNEACDKFTCAASPSVLAWSSQTDNDGDTFWVIPAKQFRISNVDNELATSGREALVDIFPNHPLIGKEVAIKTMAAFDCEDLFAGIIKPRKNFNVIERVDGKIVATVIGECSPNIVELAEAVAHHYRERIGQGYAMMFNAYSSFVLKYNKVKGNFSQFTEAEILATKACSFVFYEEVGLAGYSEANEAVFLKVDNIAKRQLGKIKAKAVSLFGVKSNKAEGKTVWDWAGSFRAQGIVQSELERGKFEINNSNAEVKVITSEAINNGLFRTLTKGYLNYQCDDISGLFKFTDNFAVDKNHPYAPAIIAWKSFVKSDLITSNVG